MSTIKTRNVQIGTDATATNNFTLQIPAVPDGTLKLSRGNSGATTADVLTVDASANVGIGISTPVAKLDIVGGGIRSLKIKPTVNGVDIPNLRTVAIENAGNDGALAFGFSTATDAWVMSATYGGTGAYKPLVLATSDVERVRIDSSGNLLVGTTTLGGNGFTFEPIGFATFARVSGPNQSMIGFKNGGSFVGEIRTSTTATQFLTSSDYRLKEAITPMTGALAKVSLLKPCTYKWKVNGSDGQGFIAHEINEIIPGCASGEKDAVDADGKPQYQGIDTSFLVATLTAAIQEQQAMIESLTHRLTALEAK